ncbi:hypothetical protein [Cellulomonas composti]|nr:hypothetical protein [Cellulomonas composti]
MKPFARDDVKAVLARFGIDSAFRVPDVDPSEEIIVLRAADFEVIDPDKVALAIMTVLPNVKVWVIQEHVAWQVEEL